MRILTATSCALLIVCAGVACQGGFPEDVEESIARLRRPQPGEQAAARAVPSGDQEQVLRRLSRALLVRTAPGGAESGPESLDPLYWPDTRHLLEGPSNARALKALDDFIASDWSAAEPSRKAAIQRDLLALYLWTFRSEVPGRSNARGALQDRLARAIGQVAMPASSIRALSPNLADAFLQSGWVLLQRAGSGAPAAEQHASAFGGRSSFLVFLRLPDGRRQTLDYLTRLGSVRDPFPSDSEGQRRPNALIPQFPDGTRLALLRQAVLVDVRGEPSPSPLTESIQLRRYIDAHHTVTRGQKTTGYEADQAFHASQDVSEFLLAREGRWPGESLSLRPTGPAESRYENFLGHDLDPFENPGELTPRVALQSCQVCHGHQFANSFTGRSGIFSVQTFLHLSDGRPGPLEESTIAAQNALGLSAINNDPELSRAWKKLRERSHGRQ